MKSRTRLIALAGLIASALVSTACAQAPPVPFRFQFSPVKIERGHSNHDRGRSYESRGHQREVTASCGCRCGAHERIRLVAGCQRGKPNRPQGWHSREWFERRGYDLRNYVHVHERTGEVHRGSRVSSGRHRH